MRVLGAVACATVLLGAGACGGTDNSGPNLDFSGSGGMPFVIGSGALPGSGGFVAGSGGFVAGNGGFVAGSGGFASGGFAAGGSNAGGAGGALATGGAGGGTAGGAGGGIGTGGGNSGGTANTGGGNSGGTASGGTAGAGGGNSGGAGGKVYPTPEPCDDPARKDCDGPCKRPGPANGCSLATCVDCPSVENGYHTCDGTRCSFDCNPGFEKRARACVPVGEPDGGAADGGTDGGGTDGGPSGSADGDACARDADCASGACVSSICTPSRCDDGRKNALETDVDCGGNCGPCETGDDCVGDADCSDGPCTNGKCACTPLACDNPRLADKCGNLDNGCGQPLACGCGSNLECFQGACCDPRAACATTCGTVSACGVSVDCGLSACDSGDVCDAGKCCTPSTTCAAGVCGEIDDGCGGKVPCGDCDAPYTCGFTTPNRCGWSCANGTPGAGETDVDCGGNTCPACGTDKKCDDGGDCASGVCAEESCGLFCTENRCQAPTCTDGVKNGTEVDVDCAGSCAQKCGGTRKCGANPDCVSGTCTDGVCTSPAHCSSNGRNGNETDVDCGGPDCVPCVEGDLCATGRDCDSGSCAEESCGFLCTENRCQ